MTFRACDRFCEGRFRAGHPVALLEHACSAARRRWTERRSGGIGMEASLGVRRGAEKEEVVCVRACVEELRIYGNKVQKEAGMHRIYEIFPGVVTLYYYPLSHLPAPLCARGALAQYQRACLHCLSLSWRLVHNTRARISLHPSFGIERRSLWMVDLLWSELISGRCCQPN